MYLLSITIISCVVFFSAEVVRADEKNNNNGKSNSTVRFCYVCTSARDPGCADGYEGSDKFPHESKLKYNYSRNCAETLPYYDAKKGEPVPVAVGCRKILQEVDSQTRVVRQCAYTRPDGADEVNGLKRTGNQGVRLFYYQCPKDYCNGATPTATMSVVVLASFLLLSIIRGQW